MCFAKLGRVGIGWDGLRWVMVGLGVSLIKCSSSYVFDFLWIG